MRGSHDEEWGESRGETGVRRRGEKVGAFSTFKRDRITAGDHKNPWKERKSGKKSRSGSKARK